MNDISIADSPLKSQGKNNHAPGRIAMDFMDNGLSRLNACAAVCQ